MIWRTIFPDSLMPHGQFTILVTTGHLFKTVLHFWNHVPFYLGHGFYVKWAGTDIKGYVPAREANEMFPQKVIKFYESKICFWDKYPFVMDLKEVNFVEIFRGKIQSLFLLFSSAKADDHKDKLAIMGEQAKKTKGKMMFVTVNTDKEDNKRILESFGIVESELPTFRAKRGEAKFKPKDDSITANNVERFVTNFQEGKLVPYLLSEEIATIATEILKDIFSDIFREDSEVKLFCVNFFKTILCLF